MESSDFFTPITGKVRKQKFAAVDIESKHEDTQRAGFTRPFMCGLYDGRQFKPFYDDNPEIDYRFRWYSPGGCVDRFMRAALTKKYRGYTFYAHNGGRFDFLFFLTWLAEMGQDMGYTFSLIPVSSSIQLLTVQGRNKSDQWKFVDSYKLMPMSLDKAAKSFQLPGKLKHDLHIPEWDRESWNKYNKQDCVQNYEVMVKFHHYVNNVLLGEVGITAPATAMKLYRRRYLQSELPRNQESHEFTRAGYFGGRTEMFIRRGEGLRYYDINSSYPRSMLELMPGGKMTPWKGKPPRHLTTNNLGFVQVRIRVPMMNIPILPVRHDTGRLIFPVGEFTGVWEWSEVELALKHGAEILEWGDSYWFEPVDMFSDYVKDLYRYRDKSLKGFDEGLAALAKLLLNSTYGKFGMKTLRREVYSWDDPSCPDEALPASNSPDSLIWYVEKQVDACYIMPQISARITSLSRQRLWNFMHQAEELGGRVYYSDTDSVITDVEMPTSTDLGELKDEYPEYSGRICGEFLGPKLYLLTADGNEDIELDALENVRAKGFTMPSRCGRGRQQN